MNPPPRFDLLNVPAVLRRRIALAMARTTALLLLFFSWLVGLALLMYAYHAHSRHLVVAVPLVTLLYALVGSAVLRHRPR